MPEGKGEKREEAQRLKSEGSRTVTDTSLPDSEATGPLPANTMPRPKGEGNKTKEASPANNGVASDGKVALMLGEASANNMPRPRATARGNPPWASPVAESASASRPPSGNGASRSRMSV